MLFNLFNNPPKQFESGGSKGELANFESLGSNDRLAGLTETQLKNELISKLKGLGGSRASEDAASVRSKLANPPLPNASIKQLE
jgi:hypothetical protein